MAEALEGRRLLSITVTTVDGVQSTAMTPQTAPTVNLYAGETLNVDGVSSTTESTDIPDPLAATFQWNFGDPASNRDNLPGFNAAHVFDTPSSQPYVVRLTVTQASGVSNVYLNVQVSNNPSLSAVYIDANGTNPNVNATTASNPTNLPDVYAAGFKSNTQYRFHRGQGENFNVNQSINVAGTNHVTFGAYGTGATPYLDATALQVPSGSIFTMNNFSMPDQNLMVEDLRLGASTSATNEPAVAYFSGKNITFRRNMFAYLGTGFDGFTWSYGNSGILLQDNSTSSDYHQLVSSFYYLGGADITIVGNTVYGSTHPENMIRSGGTSNTQRLLIYQNSLFNNLKVDVGMQSGKWAYIAQNHLGHINGVPNDWGTNTAVSIAPGLNQATETDQDMVVEGNYCDNYGITIGGGAYDTAVRDNVFNMSEIEVINQISTPIAQPAIFAEGYGYSDGMGMNVGQLELRDLRVIGNTAYSSTTASSEFLKVIDEVYNGTKTQPGIVMEDNLYSAPSTTGGSVWLSSGTGDLKSFDAVADNVWQTNNAGNTFENGTNVFEPFSWWSSLTLSDGSTHPSDRQVAYGTAALDAMSLTSPLGFTTSTSFTPLASLGSLMDSGIANAAVAADFYGYLRPSTNITVGAVQIPPPAPTDLTLSVGAASNTLNWSAVPPNALGLGNVGYNIYGSNDGVTWGTALNGATPVVGTFYTDARMTRNTYYKVTSADWGYAPGSSPQEHESTTGPTASTGSGSLSLWTSSDAPAGGAQNVFDSTAAADGGVELGIQISSSVVGYVNGVRFWKGTSNTGSHRAQLWSSAGQLLATATFTTETGSGWQQVDFTNPVLLTAGATYTVSYQATTGYLSYTPNSMGTRSNGPLSTATSTNDWYSYDAVPGTPSVPAVTNGQLPNYWVDVVFTPEATVAGRNIFYNNSVWDGNDPTANAADDGAIAPEKQALLPGAGLGSFANYTSFSKGINGIMIDVSNLHGVPTASDFIFNAGTTNTPSQWSAAPAPASVVVRPGAGTGGSTRVEVTWADYAITNEWLQVTLTADGSTLLRSSDVFYFGNLVGETGKGATGGYFSVTSADEQSARNDPHSYLNPATITDVNDFNRDARVDATDQIIARNALGDSLVDLSV